MDTVLLESRVSKKLEKSTNEARKQGWKWVEIHPAFDHSVRMRMSLSRSFASAARKTSRTGKTDGRSDALDASDELDEDQQARLDTITQRIEEQEPSSVWTRTIPEIRRQHTPGNSWPH